MISEIVLTILLISLILKLSRRPKNFPPGPRGLPLLGYAPFLSSWDPKYPHKALKKLSDVYGPVTAIYLGLSPPIISVCGHEAVKEALFNEDLNGRPQVASTLGRTFWEQLGIKFAEGPLWQEQRRFTMRHLRDLGFGKASIEDQMMDEVRDLLTDIENCLEADPNGVVDFRGLFQISVENILWAIVAGKRYKRNDPKFEQLLKANEQFFRSGNPVRGNIPVPTILVKHFKFFRNIVGFRYDCVEPIQRFLQETIDDHRKNKSNDTDEIQDFIGVYLNEMDKQKAHNPSSTFTDKQLVSIILDLFSAGAESSSNTIGFAVIHLIREPEIQSKMQAELDQVCGDSLPTLMHRQCLPYTEAVLMEAQRCSTIAPFTVPHLAMRDTQLQGYTIPKGSIIMLNLDAILQDSTYWKDPELFRPERHLNKDETKVNKSDQFYPFSAGKRSCLGESLAKNTYFLFTTALIKNFRLEAIPNEPMPSVEPTNGFTLGYEGFKAIAVPRK